MSESNHYSSGGFPGLTQAECDTLATAWLASTGKASRASLSNVGALQTKLSTTKSEVDRVNLAAAIDAAERRTK